jgi:hypothetical protein
VCAQDRQGGSSSSLLDAHLNRRSRIFLTSPGEAADPSICALIAALTSRLYRTILIAVMTSITRTHLDQLENQSIFIFRQAYHAFKNIAMPWSMGKDSNVLIWLARKSFFGEIPFPVLRNAGVS